MFAWESHGKEIILRIVRSCRKSMKLADIFSAEFADNGTTVFDSIYGDLEDALYIMNQEQTPDLESSVVDQILRNTELSDVDVTNKLYALISAK